MLDEYQALIDELLETPKALRQALRGRAPAAVPAAVLGLIADLRDRDRVVLERLQRVQREPFPHLRALPSGEELAAARAEAAGDAETLLAAFDTARGDLVSLLMNLTLKDWEKTATHETEDVVTLAEEVERHVEFDEEHVARVREGLAVS